MTQRDRLAAVLRELAGGLFEVDWYADGERMKPVLPYADDLADALLARGVRVVDADTLAAAMARECDEGWRRDWPGFAFPYQPTDPAGFVTNASRLLAALDAEP